MLKFLYENTIYTDAPSEALLKDHQQISTIFWINFLGFLALRNSVQQSALLNTYFKKDKVQLQSIAITSSDLLVSLQLAVNVHLITTSIAHEITKLFAKLKQGQIDQVDENILRTLVGKLTVSIMKTDAKIRKFITDFASGKEVLTNLISPFYFYAKREKICQEFVDMVKILHSKIDVEYAEMATKEKAELEKAEAEKKVDYVNFPFHGLQLYTPPLPNPKLSLKFDPMQKIEAYILFCRLFYGPNNILAELDLWNLGSYTKFQVLDLLAEMFLSDKSDMMLTKYTKIIAPNKPFLIPMIEMSRFYAVIKMKEINDLLPFNSKFRAAFNTSLLSDANMFMRYFRQIGYELRWRIMFNPISESADESIIPLFFSKSINCNGQVIKDIENFVATPFTYPPQIEANFAEFKKYFIEDLGISFIPDVIEGGQEELNFCNYNLIKFVQRKNLEEFCNTINLKRILNMGSFNNAMSYMYKKEYKTNEQIYERFRQGKDVMRTGSVFNIILYDKLFPPRLNEQGEEIITERNISSFLSGVVSISQMNTSFAAKFKLADCISSFKEETSIRIAKTIIEKYDGYLFDYILKEFPAYSKTNLAENIYFIICKNVRSNSVLLLFDPRNLERVKGFGFDKSEVIRFILNQKDNQDFGVNESHLEDESIVKSTLEIMKDYMNEDALAKRVQDLYDRGVNKLHRGKEYEMFTQELISFLIIKELYGVKINDIIKSKDVTNVINSLLTLSAMYRDIKKNPDYAGVRYLIEDMVMTDELKKTIDAHFKDIVPSFRQKIRDFEKIVLIFNMQNTFPTIMKFIDDEVFSIASSGRSKYPYIDAIPKLKAVFDNSKTEQMNKIFQYCVSKTEFKDDAEYNKFYANDEYARLLTDDSSNFEGICRFVVDVFKKIEENLPKKGETYEHVGVFSDIPTSSVDNISGTHKFLTLARFLNKTPFRSEIADKVQKIKQYLAKTKYISVKDELLTRKGARGDVLLYRDLVRTKILDEPMFIDMTNNYEQYPRKDVIDHLKIVGTLYERELEQGFRGGICKNVSQFQTLIKSKYAEMILDIYNDPSTRNEIDEIIKTFGKLAPSVYKPLKDEIIVGPLLLKLMHEDALIKPEIKLTPKEVAEKLKFNNFTFSETRMKLGKNESYLAYLNRASKPKAVQDMTILQPKVVKIDHTPEELEEMAAEFHEKYYSNPPRHGDTAAVITDVYDVNLEVGTEEFEAFKLKHPNSKMFPAFHGTGTVAAAMILRFGFKVVDVNTMGKIVKTTGRALGDGLYFSTVMDKILQYLGDGQNRSGGISRFGQVGYMFELEVYLGNPGEDYRSAGFSGSTDAHLNFLSPEWCVKDPRAQAKIIKAYRCQHTSRSTLVAYAKKYNVNKNVKESKYFKRFADFYKENEYMTINEEEKKFMGRNLVSYTFMDGIIPVDTDTWIDGDTFIKNYENDWLKLEENNVGTVIYIFNDIGLDGSLIVPTIAYMHENPELFAQYITLFQDAAKRK